MVAFPLKREGGLRRFTRGEVVDEADERLCFRALGLFGLLRLLLVVGVRRRDRGGTDEGREDATSHELQVRRTAHKDSFPR